MKTIATHFAEGLHNPAFVVAFYLVIMMMVSIVICSSIFHLFAYMLSCNMTCCVYVDEEAGSIIGEK